MTAVPVPPRVAAEDAMLTTGLRLSSVYVCVTPVGVILTKELPAMSATVGVCVKPSPTTPLRSRKSPPLTVTSYAPVIPPTPTMRVT